MASVLGRWIFLLDDDGPPPRKLIGGKGWSIARMQSLGLPVPPAFVITTDACLYYLEHGELPVDLGDELARAINWLERVTGRSFGTGNRPLLVSVRSGAAISMPGMMDTVLNLGITDTTERALATECGDTVFARDTHRRFLELYTSIVLRVATPPEFPKTEAPIVWRQRIAEAAGTPFLEEPMAQLYSAVRAVFDSWNSRRARRYRAHHQIPDTLGTAVTVQAMVFGNLDQQSGTGVLFSRNPLTGAPQPYGEYLPCAQGEDVVSGKFTPLQLEQMRDRVPYAHASLLEAAHRLEQLHGDMQDIEFTVERGKLFLLQSRTAKRAPRAAVRVAVDLVREGRIDEIEALRRVTPDQIRVLLRPQLTDCAAGSANPVAQGEGACPGVAIGVVIDDPDAAEAAARAGEAVILARPTTSPEDVHGMIAARAVITEQGGSTSHAAVVSRALGRPCVVGCGVGSTASLRGKTVTVDGQSGRVYAGSLPVIAPDEQQDPELSALSEWAAQHSPLNIVPTDQAPDLPTLDLDYVDGGEAPERIAELLAAHPNIRGARGGAIATDVGVRAAIARGLEFIVAEPRLPALLAAAQTKLQKQEGTD